MSSATDSRAITGSDPIPVDSRPKPVHPFFRIMAVVLGTVVGVVLAGIIGILSGIIPVC